MSALFVYKRSPIRYSAGLLYILWTDRILLAAVSTGLSGQNGERRGVQRRVIDSIRCEFLSAQ